MPRNNRTSSRASFNKTGQQQRSHSTSTSATTSTAPSIRSNSSLQSASPQQQPAVIQVQNGGILSNILQTAAGVAVGHTVGRMVSGLFEGSSPSTSNESTNETSKACQVDTQRFLDCMSRNYDDVSACQNYLDMLKACQSQFGQ